MSWVSYFGVLGIPSLWLLAVAALALSFPRAKVLYALFMYSFVISMFFGMAWMCLGMVKLFMQITGIGQ